MGSIDDERLESANIGTNVIRPIVGEIDEDDEDDEDDFEESEESPGLTPLQRREERLRRAVIEVRSCVAAHSRRLARNMMLRYKQQLKPHRITVTELQVLVEIVLKPNVTAAALCETLELDKSTVSRIIERLLENDWISVGVSRDARALPVALQYGMDKRLLQALRAWREAHHSVLGWLGEDAPSLLRLAQRLRPPPRNRHRPEHGFRE